jgi:6-phosphogluconolactonase (cycloisomerase 2 family)
MKPHSSPSIHRTSRRLALAAAAVAFGVVGVAGVATTVSASAPSTTRPHFVYTSTNSAAGNSVLTLRSKGGVLAQVASTSTGGTGTGSSLGSQGAIAVDDGHVFVVDAGSNDVAVFSTGNDGHLRLTDRVGSGGTTPVSITVHDDVVYVLDEGSESVAGFRLDGGHLLPIAGSHQSLTGVAGAEIAFNHEGTQLVVTEKGTNTIEVLPVHDDVAQAPIVNASSGVTPYGFAIDRHDHILVTNAAGGAPLGSSVSSYVADHTGVLHNISSAVPTTQTAACWLAISTDGRFAYDTNAGSGTISRYAIAADGSLTLVDAIAARPGSGPVDLVTTPDSLFTLNSGSHTVSLHAIAADGSLTAVAGAPVPVGATGLAAD